ncbi:MAG: hypothetical protein V2A58_10775 [Planctomycetota bacterium]
MTEMPPGDPFVENVLAHVSPDVASTLTRAQWDGLRDALERSRSRSRHAIDLRFVIPLYFLRVYFVLILGKDRRRAVRGILVERRRRATRAAIALVLAFLFVFLAGLLFLSLYVLKSAAGINIFPRFHLSDWLPGFR